LGKTEGSVCAKEGRSPSQEIHCPPPYEPRDEEENVGFDESSMGGEEESWRKVIIEP
jgi:hypothetical protein